MILPGPFLTAFACALCLLASAPLASAFSMSDPAGDVTMGNDPYDGAGAKTVDIRAAAAEESGNDIVFRLQLEDLAELPQEAKREDLHIQYSLSFRADQTPFSARALFRGAERAGQDEGCWEFHLHNQASDKWPRADGRIDGDTIVWNIPRKSLDGASLGSLSDWTVQTWSSGNDLQQFGDRAESTGASDTPLRGGTGEDGSTHPTCARLLPATGFASGALALGFVAMVLAARRPRS